MKVNKKKIGQGQAITLMYFGGVSGIDITGLVLSGLYSARHPPCQIDRQNFTIHFVQISPQSTMYVSILNMTGVYMIILVLNAKLRYFNYCL